MQDTINYIHQVMQEDRFDLAFQTLDQIYPKKSEQERAQLALLAAELYALHGPELIDEGLGALMSAAELDETLAETPRFQVLRGFFLSYGEDTEDASEDALAGTQGDDTSRFFAACTLMNLGEDQQARDILHVLAEDRLPEHLKWRFHAWYGKLLDQAGEFQPAGEEYRSALRLVKVPWHQFVLSLDLSNVLLSQNELSDAQKLLEFIESYLDLVTPEQKLQYAYTLAQVHLNQSHYPDALKWIEEADRLEKELGDPSYGVALVFGQALMGLGRPAEALVHFKDALNLTETEASYCLHEIGIAHLDSDQPLEALENLQQVLRDPDYAYLPEAQADLADAEYRMGRLTEAETLAQDALEQGAVVPASLVLGNIAMDYYHLDEALNHYQRVADTAAEGGREWLVSQQMMADILVQQGFAQPDHILVHAEQALKFTDPSDDWYLTLQGYVSRAKDVLQQADQRTLN
ncbi:tetratricopeptide repeat protein [Deinococcus roseus]|uniref:tetratricopeptide repeat protein n=1 Tax=Deinococcus roseus TaxID=392414 RepID=UPI001663DE79|nr:tetratricopeptide repeat protein [Deinococcus roseus]